MSDEEAIAPPTPPGDSSSPGTDAPAVTPADGIWICRVENSGANEAPMGPISGPLTVGEKFVLSCEGATVPLDKSKLSLRLPKKEKYSLRLLRVQSLDENKGVFTATSYRVGEGPVPGVVLSDGARSVSLEGIQLSLTSVIRPEENPEGKPYAPIAPIAMPWPLWLWLIIGATVLAVFSLFYFVFRRRSQRKALLAELARHGSALTPYHQFNKDLRSLGREFPMQKASDWNADVARRYVDELNRRFRWYLAREFTVPAFQWSDGLILGEIKKRDKRLYTRVAPELRLTLRELRKAMGARDQLQAFDGQQMVELCRKVADRIDQERR